MPALSLKQVIVIGGPTAVGKTSVVIEVAKHFDTEIISADSRQCYQELNIGVARPSEKELNEVKHHFIASHSIQQKVTAATFEEYALEKAAEIFKVKDVLVMVGGTGLYIKAFCEGLDEIPDVADEIRNEVISEYKLKGIDWLQEEVRNADPGFYQSGEIKNPQRLMRALEVNRATGKSIIDFRTNEKKERPFQLLKFVLELPKEQLHDHINMRVDKMMNKGLLEEVRSLTAFQNVNALQTVGYKELFDYLNGNIALADAVEEIKKNTRQYAKRQMTWFRKDKEYRWFDPRQLDIIINFLNNK